jgi:hypothetical protein
MTRRSKIWLVVAVLFILANFAGGLMAAWQGELLHSGVHVGLLLLGVYVVRRLAPRRDALPRLGALTDRLTQLEQSLDAIAIEVERIGEGQRFMLRLFTENGTRQTRGEGTAEPNEVKAQEAPQVRRD